MELQRHVFKAESRSVEAAILDQWDCEDYNDLEESDDLHISKVAYL